MKKLIALLLAALMAVTGALACAETAPASSVTIVNAITFNRDTCRKIMADIGLNAEQVELVESVLALIETSGQNLVITEDGFEYNMILGGNTVATLAGDITPEGLSIGSNLFPHYILTVTNATIEEMLAQFTAGKQAEEVPAGEQAEVKEAEEAKEVKGAGLMPELIAATRDYSGELLKLITSGVSVGEPVTGEYTVDGDTYNAMLPVTIDTRAIADGVTDLTDKLIHSEPFEKLQAVLRSVDIDIPLEAPVFSAVPAVSATVYACQDDAGNINGALYVEVGIALADGAEPLIQARVRLDGENVRVAFGIPALELEAKFEQFMSDEGGFMRLDGSFRESYFGLALELTLGDENHFSFNVYYPDASTPLMSDDIAIIRGGQRLYSVEGRNKTTLSLEKLISGEEQNGSWISLLVDVAIYSTIEIMSIANHDQPVIENLIGQLWGY